MAKPRKDAPDAVALSPAAAIVLRRFTELDEADQLSTYAVIRDFLAAQDWDANPDPVLDARAEALAALRSACRHLGLDDPTQLEVKRFDGLPSDVRLGLTAQRVLRAFGTWSKAKSVLAGERGWDTARQRSIRKAAGAMRLAADTSMEGVREWLATNPPNLSMTSYDDWRRERNRKTIGKELPYAGYRSLSQRHEIGWAAILAVAQGKMKLAEATKIERKARTAKGKGEHDLVTTREIVTITGTNEWTIQGWLHEDDFPVPVVVKGKRRFWLRGDIEAYARGEKPPKRTQNELGNLYVDHVEADEILGGFTMAGRTKGHPDPIYSGVTRLWVRAEVEAHQRERPRRGKYERRGDGKARSHSKRA